MQDRFKFRYFYNGKMYEVISFDIEANTVTINTDDTHFLTIGHKETVFKNLVQCTGLKDGTKWDELSQKEKQDFYNQICIENGKDKYQSIDDVAHLWNGKLIFEGDIVKVRCFREDKGGMFYKKGIIAYSINEKDIGGYAYSSFYLKLDNEPCALFESEKTEIIGNIYENPELLRV